MVSKKGGGEMEFINSLREHKDTAVKGPGMILNKPPAGQGKSLDELLETEASTAHNSPSPVRESEARDNIGTILKIGLNFLDDSPFQPRLRYDETYIRDLSGSLEEIGQKEVITVRPSTGTRFEIINGHCRVRAARLARWPDIEARIVAVDDRQAELSALVQNETRKDLTDYERARLYQRAIDTGLAKNQTTVARIFGCSDGRVSQALSMLNLPEPIIAMLNQYPALFGYRAAKDILDLLKRHPGEETVVTQAVARLIEGAQASSIKGWVEQTLSRRRGRPSKTGAIAVVNPEGRVMFRANTKSRQVIVDITSEMDPLVVQQWIVADLRKRIESQDDRVEPHAAG